MSWQPVPPHQQVLLAGQDLPRHLHAQGYLAVVLRGRYWETNASGRKELRPGDVAAHSVFSAHANQVGQGDAVVVNLGGSWGGLDCFLRLADLDAASRALERDPAGAAALVRAMLVAAPARAIDWPDQLAAALLQDPLMSITQWARSNALAPETVSRGFRRVYGATPKRVRFEHRSRRAIHMLVNGSLPLASVALEAGFPDQACMTRALRVFAGLSPAALRRGSSGDKTGGRALATLAG